MCVSLACAGGLWRRGRSVWVRGVYWVWWEALWVLVVVATMVEGVAVEKGGGWAWLFCSGWRVLGCLEPKTEEARLTRFHKESGCLWWVVVGVVVVVETAVVYDVGEAMLAYGCGCLLCGVSVREGPGCCCCCCCC